MTKMSIYGKENKDFLRWNQCNLVCNIRDHNLFLFFVVVVVVFSKYSPGLILTYFSARSNFITSAFI